MEESQREAVTRVIALAVVAILLSFFAAALASSVDARPFSESQSAGVKLALIPTIPGDTPEEKEAKLAEEAAKEEAARKKAIEEKCKELIAKGVPTPTITNQPFTEHTIEDSLCVGVVTEKPAFAGAATTLACTGKYTKVSMNAKGEGTISSTADPGVEKGKCWTLLCDDKGENCTPSKAFLPNLDGTLKITDPSIFSLLDSAKQEGIANALSSTERNKLIEEYFNPAEAQVKTQIEKNDTTINRLKGIIDNCPSCSAEKIEEYTKEKDALEKQNTGLEEQRKYLAAAKVVLTPESPPETPPAPPPGPPGPPGAPGSTFPPPGGGGGFLQGLLQSLLGGQQGSTTPAAGNRTAQPAGTCKPELICVSSVLYSRNTQCVDARIEECEFGCAKRGKACTPASDPKKCSNEPNKPKAEKCKDGSWEPERNKKDCIRDWKCVPEDEEDEDIIPTAQISCQPRVADVGMTVAVTYGCSAGTSEGDGFDTGGARSGSATVVLSDPAAGSSNVFFGVTCTENDLSDFESCEIRVAKPGIAFTALPESVEPGGTSNIGWVTSGMGACSIASPQQPDFIARNANFKGVTGTAKTDPITETTEIILTCTTLGGQTREETTTITIIEEFVGV